MSEFLTNFAHFMSQGLFTALMLFGLFGGLELFMPCNPGQPRSGKALLANAGYFFIVPLFSRLVQSFYLIVGASILFYGSSPETIRDFLIHGYGPLAPLPLWLKGAMAFILSDIILYWIHRGFHRREMWKYHAIHHSSKHVEWHSTYRFHPVNIWLSFTLVDAVMVLLGLSMESIALFSTFNLLYSAMVHANLKWTFGPFKYVFASPVFHRWHHTMQEEGMDKNFAPTFPLLDIMFGTFYMPEGRVPEHFGVAGSDIPESFLGQMIWPFKTR